MHKYLYLKFFKSCHPSGGNIKVLSSLIELKLFCKEEQAEVSFSRCSKLAETSQKIASAVIAAKDDSTED